MNGQKSETIQTKQFESDLILEEARYLRLVYIGSSGCGFSNNELTHQMIRQLKVLFRSLAHDNGYRFLSRGIAVDPSSEQGVIFLNQSGPYDEMISGSTWFNLGVYQYIWDSLPGYASTPQVLITISTYEPTFAGNEIGYINKEEKLLMRISGMSEIQELLDVTKHSTTQEFGKRIGLLSQL